MESKYFKIPVLILFLASQYMSIGQGNPGFIGKKLAIGYNSQVSIIQPILDFSLQKITFHNLYIERAINKYSSFSADILFANVNIFYTKANRIHQEISMGPDKYLIDYTIKDGNAAMSILGIGAKYSDYFKNKTISSPVGISQYLKADLIITKALKNNFNYIVESANSSLTSYQRKYAETNINKNIKSANHFSFNIGYGIETKIAFTRSVFLRINGEFNLSSRLLVGINSYSSDDYYLSVSDDLNETARDITKFRNMFLVGMGIGMLL